MLMKQQLEAVSISGRIRSLMGADTETAFAHRVRVAPHLIAVCLQGRVPDAPTLARISETCHVSLDWLLRGISSDGAKRQPVEERAPATESRSVPPPASLIVNHPDL